MAESLGLSSQRVYYVLGKHGVKTRGRAFSRSCCKHLRVYKEKPLVDPQWLSYYLGLLATDGCLSDKGDVRLELKSEDYNVVCCFGTSVVEDSHLTFSPPKTGSFSKGNLSTGSYIFAARLNGLAMQCAEIGITPRKSKILSINYLRVKKPYWFLRGVIDGDGSVHVGVRKCDCSIRIVSASPEFLEQTKEKFGGRINRHGKGELWVLTFKGQNALRICQELPSAPEMVARKSQRIRQIMEKFQ